jgi:hypothetical protein
MNVSPFVVLGTPRSGTSVVSGLLHASGVTMGVELPSEGDGPRYDWPVPNPMNPTGFYQDCPVENVQQAIWSERVPDVGARPDDAKLIAEFQSLIRIRIARGIPWGIKTSLMPWMIGELLEVAPDARFVVTSRPAQLCKKSWDKWTNGEWETDRRIDNAAKQIAKVLQEYPHIPRHTVAFYDLLDRTEATLEALATFIGLPLNAKARSMIDPALRRVF